MSNKQKSKTIRVNSLVRTYNTAHLKEIAGMSCDEVYTSFKSDGTIVTSRCVKCKELLDALCKIIPAFSPILPTSKNDIKNIKKFHNLWLAHLNDLQNDICKPAKPIYLVDEVNKILKSKGSNLECQSVHLEWYLWRHQGKEVEPKRIADDILAYDGTDWSKVPRLKKDKEYHIHLYSSNPKDAQMIEVDRAQDGNSDAPRRKYNKDGYEHVTRVFEYIWQIPSVPGIKDLQERLENDLSVLTKYAKRYRESVSGYDFAIEYQKAIDSLHTLPESARKIRFATPEVNKKAEGIQAGDEGSQPETASPTPSVPADAPAEVQDEAQKKEQERTSAPVTPESTTNGEGQHWMDYQQNLAELKAYLSGLAPRVQHLEYAIDLPGNQPVFLAFAKSNDFHAAMRTLRSNTAGNMPVSYANIMQFIQKVAEATDMK